MPAVRSFYTLSILAACLAQVWAGDYNGGGGDGYSGGQGQGQGKGGGGGGWSGGSGGNGWSGGSGGGNNQYQASTVYQTSVVTVAAPTTIFQAQDCAPPATSTTTETTTITAVSPCTASVVTAYVTQWQNAPPGCWCGPPPAFVSALATAGGAAALLGNAPVFTSTNPAFTPGLSSIPASQAVQTGVTVAAAAAAPAPTASAGSPAAAVSPGGFFTESSSGE
ncbi:hypothetical protein A1O3_03967 [Capronia epimyces CBS 606.96]|uniref:Uncharacterized protein n=1 Tax=Capronia epimyces CBS 606.96 TaxID=1182542 RepID=W9YBI1_9EURO|nr:uncharacterized protein A1O3_03967 [Capronia epimyces CBS 606.96]EXJ87010.1 hypothetical protein A1O3_03967 [Capronia epimyces CBS 606.96]